MQTKNEITLREINRLLELKKILFEISKARGTPNRLKKLITLLINKIDRLLVDDIARKRLSTINLLIDITKKVISILQWIK
jgi:hypothetical protein